MKLKGTLYLPPDESLRDAAKKVAGLGSGEENKKRNTLHLSKWAAAKPEDNEVGEEPYYRAVILSILTKAGDFRVISAKNMYVTSYNETYDDGEFGTFELSLAQKVDLNAQQQGGQQETTLVVDGLATEKFDKIGAIMSGIAKATAAVAGTAAVASAIVKTTTETVEKFTGETDATRKIKGVLGATTAATQTLNVGANFANSIRKKDAVAITENTQKLTDATNNLILTSKSAHENHELPLATMEAMYLKAIMGDHKKYLKYINSSESEKYKMLKEVQAALLKDTPTDTPPADTKPTNTTPVKTKSPKNKSARRRRARNSTADGENNVSLSGANISDMLDEAINKKNGNSQ